MVVSIKRTFLNIKRYVKHSDEYFDFFSYGHLKWCQHNTSSQSVTYLIQNEYIFYYYWSKNPNEFLTMSKPIGNAQNDSRFEALPLCRQIHTTNFT